MIKSNILFISTGNSIRSQIAEAFAKQIVKNDVTVHSAGVGPLNQIYKLTMDLMKSYGIDISNQKPKLISELQIVHFDLVVTLSSTAKKSCSSLAGAPIFLHWPIESPLTSGKAKIKTARRLLNQPVEIENPLAFEETKIHQTFKQCAEQIKGLVFDLFNFGYLEAFVVQKKNVDRIFNSLSDGIIAHDLDKKVFYFSKRASELTGLSEEKAIYKTCEDIFDMPLCGFNCSFCEVGKIDDFEIKSYNAIFHDANGVRKECKVTVVPMKDEQGQIQGVVASLCDITSQRSLEWLLAKENIFGGIIGNDSKMLQIFQQIRDVSSYDYPVHIFGETGTGKELVAKAIHNESTRKNMPFIAINCGALPAGLIESELFGYVKGAFTGAIRDKKGRFELAEGGTVFLDEIADLSKQAQAKLLRFLQEGTLERVGSEHSTTVDIRIISATNLDLKEEVSQNNFREDLYYRLNVIPIEIPPLRNRKNDIPLLCDHFLDKINQENGNNHIALSKEALTLIMDYSWPGNVRELESAIKFAVVKCQTQTVLATDLPKEIRKNNSYLLLPNTSKKLDKQKVIKALNASEGNKVKAAKILGVGRATLYRFFDKHPEIQK